MFWGVPLSDRVGTARPVIFVGGPGRSGTSFVADRLGRHPHVCAFPNSELKLFTEKNGLMDLRYVLVESYSPNRATVALDQFIKFYAALVDGRFGQEALVVHAARPEWMTILDEFVAILTQDRVAGPTDSETFHAAARRMLWSIADLASRNKPPTTRPHMFLEKTPHSLLAVEFLTSLAPGCALLHVMRDPRSIAYSLRSMTWGPERLSECCIWDANYCQAWLLAQTTAAKLGHGIVCTQIEEIACDPAGSSERICATLGLESFQTLFRKADIQTLNGWRERCSPEDYSELDSRLGGWAQHFGYSPTRVGELTTPTRECTPSNEPAENHAA